MISFTFIIAASFLGLNNPWYGSTLCFVLGIFYAQYEGKINNFLKSHYLGNICLVSVIMSIGIVMFFKLGEQSFIGNVVGRNIASTFFCICFIMIMMKFTIQNTISEFLGKISYEIFLVHPIIISMIGFDNVVINTGICIFITCILGCVLHYIVVKILRKKF